MASTSIPAYGGTVLHSGSSGPDVALVQRWLNGIHTQESVVHEVTVDGKFGSGTTASVKAFQTLEGLTPDGKVGQDTWDRLYHRFYAIFGENNIYPGIALRVGQQGATVKSAQVRLKGLIPNLSTDGKFGESTKNAVYTFQICSRLPADGILGKETWAILFGTSAR